MKLVRVLSVVIVVKNDREIAGTLKHLKGLACPIPFEVIVVDASLPEKLADIRKRNSWVRWDQFPFSDQRTTAAQRNRGVELALGDAIAFIDANCIPGKHWLEAMVEAFADGKDIVCGPVLDANTKNLVHYAPKHEEGRYVDVCTTISVGIRRAVFDKAGVFDTSFGFGQDIDFFWRAGDAGFRIYYHPQMEISHNWGSQSEQLRRAYQYGKARAHLFKKHWRLHKKRLLYEPHVWAYPVFMLGLPFSVVFPYYPLILLVPIFKNLNTHPFKLVLHHLTYGVGVISGAVKAWPKA